MITAPVPASAPTSAPTATTPEWLAIHVGIADHTWVDFPSNVPTRDRDVNVTIAPLADGPRWSSLEEAIAGATELSRARGEALAVLRAPQDAAAGATFLAGSLAVAYDWQKVRWPFNSKPGPQAVGAALDLLADVGDQGDVAATEVRQRAGGSAVALVQALEAGTRSNGMLGMRPELVVVELVSSRGSMVGG